MPLEDTLESELLNRPSWLARHHDLVDQQSDEAAWFDEILDKHVPPSVESWSTASENGWIFELSICTIQVEYSEWLPLRVTASSGTLPRKSLDVMRQDLRDTLLEFLMSEEHHIVLAITLLQLVEIADGYIEEWQRRSQQTLDTARGWDVRHVEDWSSILDNPNGVDLSSIEDSALDLLGEPIADICSRVSQDLRILHVEPVFRNNLVARLLARKRRMLTDLRSMGYRALRSSLFRLRAKPGAYEDSVRGLADVLARPSVTFHGAPFRVIQSIVRYGFVLPGHQVGKTDHILGTRCGQTYGSGIYSSPDPMFASVYSNYAAGKAGAVHPSDVPGMRLLVCATLMGHTLRCEPHEARGVTNPLDDDSHSHISPDKLQYVVFDEAQIIPCYVLHLDYGAKRAREEFDKITANPDEYFQRRRRQQPATVNKWTQEQLFPGDVQRKKEERKAAAAKWFAYGYGPAHGNNFVIEEIGEVSDDEEEYGEFQAQRVDMDNEDELRQQRIEAGGSWFDQYQSARMTYQELHMENS